MKRNICTKYSTKIVFCTFTGGIEIKFPKSRKPRFSYGEHRNRACEKTHKLIFTAMFLFTQNGFIKLFFKFTLPIVSFLPRFINRVG